METLGINHHKLRLTFYDLIACVKFITERGREYRLYFNKLKDNSKGNAI